MTAAVKRKRTLEKSRKAASTVQTVTVIPPLWLQKAAEWKIDPSLMSKNSILRVVQYHAHHINQVSLRDYLKQKDKTYAVNESPVVAAPSALVEPETLRNFRPQVRHCKHCKRAGGTHTDTVQSKSADEGATEVIICRFCNRKTTLEDLNHEEE